jgi:hypothetical protein
MQQEQKLFSNAVILAMHHILAYFQTLLDEPCNDLLIHLNTTLLKTQRSFALIP